MKTPARAAKEYLQILHLAATENETQVNQALRMLLDRAETISSQTVKEILDSQQSQWCVQDVFVQDMELFFNLISERYERGSLLISSNLPFKSL